MTTTPTPKNVLIFLLDRSGSMGAIKASTIESFNGYLKTLQDSTPDIEYTEVWFDTIAVDVMHRRIPITTAPGLDPVTYTPRGGTPLLDAACITLTDAMEKYAQTDKVIFTILTDGHENESRQYKRADLHDLIKTVTGWGWQVVFLGASIDAYADAGQAGISRGSTMSYNAANQVQANSALRASATNAAAWYASAAADVAFDAAQKQAAGDAFVKATITPKAAGGEAARKTLVDKADL